MERSRESVPNQGRAHVMAWRTGRVGCMLCVSGASGRAAYEGHSCWAPARPRPPAPALGYIMKRIDQANADGGFAEADASDILERFPLLSEYLCCTSWDDGKPRQVATLLIVTECGAWKACLNDRAQARSLWVSAEGFDSLLWAVETALGSPAPGWRPAKVWSKGK